MNPTPQTADAAIRDHHAVLTAALRQRVPHAAVPSTSSDHLAYLAQALALDNPALFTDYVAWAKVMLGQRGIATADFAAELHHLADLIAEQLPADTGTAAVAFVRAAIAALPALPDELPTFLHPGEPLSPLAHQYLEALRRGERHLASRLVLDAVATGAAIRDIYLHVFAPTQHEIGRLWQINKISVAQEHYCTAATQLIMSQLYTHLFSADKKGVTLVATCVSGDLHELGVRMVADFFEMDGWNTFYLGANTPHADIISTIIARRADVLAVSATIAHHVADVDAMIRAVRADPECAHVKILVGGSPFNRDPDLSRRLGADGTAADAQRAIELANTLVHAGTA